MLVIGDFGWVGIYILAAFLLLSFILGLSKLLRPDKPYLDKNTSYESGEEVVSNARVAFKNTYYVVALVFVLFEVELLLIFPWATVFGDAQIALETAGLWLWYGILDMFVFMGVLAIGLLYVWKKGHLDWLTSKENVGDNTSAVPLELYQKLNEKYQ